MIRKLFRSLSQPPGTAKSHLHRPRTLAIEHLESRRLLSVGAVSPSSIITTVAGSAAHGFGGDNGSAVAAELNNPADVAVDAVGDLFIVDQYNYRVREVNAATGIITTIGGNGTEESSNASNGDGGPATNAEIAPTGGIAVDAAGDVFFAEYSNNRVREVNHATGIITTVAGNGGRTNGYLDQLGGPPLATAVGVQSPSGLAIDAAGDLFISEDLSNGNSDVREVYYTPNYAASVITTVAGVSYDAPYGGFNGTATSQFLAGPAGLAVDAAGDLFIADAGDNVVREVNLANDAIVTVAGSGKTGYTADGGQASAADLNSPVAVATDGAGHLFIADDSSYTNFTPEQPMTYDDSRVLEVNLPTGVINTIAGQYWGASYAGAFGGDGGPASAAELNSPSGLAMDAAGDLYVADSGNDRIREITAGFSATGVPVPIFALSSPVAGTFAAGMSVTIQWMAKNVDLAGPSKISLGYDADATPFDANQHWMEIDGVTAGGSASYAWNTAGIAAGTYYVSGYMYDFSIRKAYYSNVSTPIVILNPLFTLSGPRSGTFFAGQGVTFQWSAGNVDVAGPSKISLGYDPDSSTFDANQRWIEVDHVTAANGAGSYSWNTSGLATGTYYLDGYMYDFAIDRAVFSHLATTIVIGPPTFTLAAPSSKTFTPGQTATIGWTAADVDVAASTKITLGYDPDSTPFGANQRWIEIDGVTVTAVNGAASFSWNTAAMAAGTYYLDGYLYDFATHHAVYSAVAASIVIT
jgi:hypothetical protein